MNGSLLEIASSSNGRTADSDSVNLGSNPGEAANFRDVRQRGYFLSFFVLKIYFYFFLPLLDICVIVVYQLFYGRNLFMDFCHKLPRQRAFFMSVFDDADFFIRAMAFSAVALFVFKLYFFERIFLWGYIVILH